MLVSVACQLFEAYDNTRQVSDQKLRKSFLRYISYWKTRQRDEAVLLVLSRLVYTYATQNNNPQIVLRPFLHEIIQVMRQKLTTRMHKRIAILQWQLIYLIVKGNEHNIGIILRHPKIQQFAARHLEYCDQLIGCESLRRVLRIIKIYDSPMDEQITRNLAIMEVDPTSSPSLVNKNTKPMETDEQVENVANDSQVQKIPDENIECVPNENCDRGCKDDELVPPNTSSQSHQRDGSSDDSLFNLKDGTSFNNVSHSEKINFSTKEREELIQKSASKNRSANSSDDSLFTIADGVRFRNVILPEEGCSHQEEEIKLSQQNVVSKSDNSSEDIYYTAKEKICESQQSGKKDIEGSESCILQSVSQSTAEYDGDSLRRNNSEISVDGGKENSSYCHSGETTINTCTNSASRLRDGRILLDKLVAQTKLRRSEAILRAEIEKRKRLSLEERPTLPTQRRYANFLSPPKGKI